jgi:hypothetical protein
MEEIWKPVVGYEGLYEVSNFGRVRSIKNGRERNLIPIKCGKYLGVRLYKNNVIKAFYIHRLVLLNFIGEAKSVFYQCDHIDRNKFNNKLDNLRWVDASTNLLNRNTYGNTDLKGVCFCKKQYTLKDGTVKYLFFYKSQIKFNDKNINLGHYKTKEEAYEEYKKAHLKYRGYEWMG